MIFFQKRNRIPPSPLLLSSEKKVSFCITHQNREEYLQRTLLTNLEDCLEQRSFTEFVLMDFNTNSMIRDWVFSEFRDFLKEGYLKYYHSDRLETWHASIAKNASHSVAEGAILVNLDCDNYTGPEGSQFIVDTFSEYPFNIVLWQFSGKKQDGSFGRIALTRDMFFQLGGYDESFLPMGYQDDDLLDRARHLGLVKVRSKDKRFNQCIRHEKYRPSDISYKEMKMRNKKLSKMHIRQGRLEANGGFPLQLGIKRMDHKGNMIPWNHPTTVN